MSIDELLARLETLSPNLIDAALQIAEEEGSPIGDVIALLYRPHCDRYQPTRSTDWERSSRPANF